MAEQPSYNPGFVDRVLIKLFHFFDPIVPWTKLPSFMGLMWVGVIRTELRMYNLHDTYPSGEAQGTKATCPMKDKRYLEARQSDGMYNSLEQPRMGCAGMRFGRNFPRKYCKKPTQEELYTPNPRLVSEKFMVRKEDGFIPATTLNLLAAAWIQFQTHDWFHHDTNEDDSYNVPLPKDHTWTHGKMNLRKSIPDKVLDPSDEECPAYCNTSTPWWDNSQIYGNSEEVTQSLRDKHPDGKLLLTKKGRENFLPRGKDGMPETGFNDNWWIGMEMLHTLFAMEHNSICDMLREKHPDWTGDQIFDKARLINCALTAKIHTVEWTPAIVAHPTVKIGMSVNWWGIAGEKLWKMLGRISKTSEAISGIPGSGADQHGVPYSLTEEFVSVYRLHALVPDNVAFFSVAERGAHQSTIPIVDTIFRSAQKPLDDGLSWADTFYSFGINYPGAVTNHNYPNFLCNLQTPDGQLRDMGTVDILRDRERGVPRYNQFRRLLHMSAPKTFEELTGGNKPLAALLAEVYNNDIELVDAMVGMHSEPLPVGFGFSETAFRIFIVMASRRLKSDRFIADNWNEEMYTKEGFHWVQNVGMKEVLLRHMPELEEVLRGQENVFAPWTQLPESRKYKGRETNAKV